MNRRRFAVLIVSAMALAGCAGSAPEPSAPTPPPDAEAPPSPPPATNGSAPEATPAPVLDITWTGCSALVPNFGLTDEDTRALLPPGFEPVPFLGTPNTGTGVLFSVACERFEADGVSIENHREYWVYLGVTPPPELRIGGNDGYRAVLAHYVSSDEAAAAYRARGVPAETAQITTTRTDAGETGYGNTVLQAADRSLTFDVVGEDTGVTPEVDLRYFFIEDGAVAAVMDAELSATLTSHLGAAEFRTDSGEPPFGRPTNPGFGVLFAWPPGERSVLWAPGS